MGIQIEFDADLALRKPNTNARKSEECIPENLEEGKIYNFLKKGQRLYWMKGEVPLLITEGNEQLSKPIASIIILEIIHLIINNEIWTKGKYKIVKIINNNEVYFNGCNKIK